jgi:hypothetical protein
VGLQRDGVKHGVERTLAEAFEIERHVVEAEGLEDGGEGSGKAGSQLLCPTQYGAWCRKGL